MPLTYSQHAIDRMYERSITTSFVEATVGAGNYVLQAHNTRLYNATYQYQSTIAIPVLNYFGQQLFDIYYMPLFNYQVVLNTFSVSVVTDAAGTHVVTVWWT
ncbi:DUF4258 domain-containing protein [Pseudomonas sp. GM55]|uniref:DUF4258 domain-containing protein n=1 Tax=Pseudomonas sp. GM55 TaxID=1144333 RepID=UPI0002707F67|nr:DUF4258 domain-containing protein [Pseudomonas sp. GM55]EJM75598.1 hypothetical protein PMI31_01781 [Pseudomonas sp. GM55]